MASYLSSGGLAVVLALLITLLALIARHQRRERTARQELADAQGKGFAEVLDELTSLRSALVATGAAERPPRLPPAPFSLPSVAREVVSVTRDDDPIHTRPTVESPPLAGEVRVPDEPVGPAPLEATLASAASPVAVRIAEAAAKAEDAEGETTLRREGDRPASLTLPRAHADDEDDRDTGEDLTKVYGRSLRAVRDPLAGVEPERPTSSAARTAEAFRKKRPTLLGGLAHHGAPKNDGHEDGDGG